MSPPDPRMTEEELDAIAVLSRRGRLFVVIIPPGIPAERIFELTRDVNALLEELVAERGPLT
jgi:hypothetical protein